MLLSGAITVIRLDTLPANRILSCCIYNENTRLNWLFDSFSGIWLVAANFSDEYLFKCPGHESSTRCTNLINHFFTTRLGH